MPKVKKLSKSETLNRLLSFSSVAVLIHRSPDGDALGSGAALCLFLRRAGVDATLLSPDPIPPRLAFLCEGVPLCKEESPAYIVTVDVASLSQCGRLAPAVWRQARSFRSIITLFPCPLRPIIPWERLRLPPRCSSIFLRARKGRSIKRSLRAFTLPFRRIPVASALPTLRQRPMRSLPLF